MYIEVKTDDRSLVEHLLADYYESAEPVMVAIGKRGGLYRLVVVQDVGTLNRLLPEMFVGFDVLRSIHQHKPRVMTAVVARRKRLAVDARHFVFRSMHPIM